MPPKTTPLSERFWTKVDKRGDDECWEWTACLSRAGYGKIGRCGRGNGFEHAHRAAYELAVGPIPDGLQIDHLCRNRKCVNPSHLEPVTMRENIARGESPPAQNARKTHCPQGHAYDEKNTYYWRGWRRCRACDRMRKRER